MPYTKEQSKENIQKLVENYLQKKQQGVLDGFKEEQVKQDFILPLFDYLNWDIRNENFDEVRAEYSVSRGEVDYAFKIDGVVKFFLEAKSFREGTDDPRYLIQAINYGYHRSITWVVLTDFKTLKLLNSEFIEKNLLNNVVLRLEVEEFIDRFDDLWLLSKTSFMEAQLEKWAERLGKKSKRVPIDKQLLLNFTAWRGMLSKNILAHNKTLSLDEQTLDEVVQRILDRLIFIRKAEDAGLEEKHLKNALREWENAESGGLYKYIQTIFRDFDNRYDSELFAHHSADKAIITNNILHAIIEGLYETEDRLITYNFADIPADVLGNIYEQYLGYILKKTKKSARIEQKFTLRKEKGIYYTPTFIVDFIVRNTIGKLFQNKSPSEIRILDPACGSGSFLIKAFDVFNESSNEDSFIHRSRILTENIYGVDLDEKAVEITQLNLLLKTVEKRKLPMLKNNIRRGNSLIDDKKIAKDKTFVWEKEFKDILDEGGFDSIVGNPPYGIVFKEDEKSYLEQRYETFKRNNDIFVAFVQRSIELLKPGGLLGFILPNTFLLGPYFNEMKKFILENMKILKIVDFGNLSVFQDPTIFNTIVILQKEIDKQVRDNNVISYTVVQSLDKFLKNNFSDIKINQQSFQSLHWQPLDATIGKINKIKTRLGDIAFVKDVGINYWTIGRGKTRGGSIASRVTYEGKRKNVKDLPFLKGRNIHRYGYVFGDHWLIHDYEKELHKNDVFRFSPKFLFVSQKIIYRQTADRIIATIDTQQFLVDKTVHLIVLQKKFNNIDMKYLLAILNSKLLTYIYRGITGEEGATFAQVKTFNMNKLPILLPIDLEHTQRKIYDELIEHADEMIRLTNEFNKVPDKTTNAAIRILEQLKRLDTEIDNKVYKLYGISDEEIKLIDESVAHESRK